MEVSVRQGVILEELTEIALAEGINHLTVAVLVDRLHCSRRTLYTLAPSRDALILRVIETQFDQWLDAATAAAAQAAGSEPVDAVVDYLVASLDIGAASDAFLADLENGTQTSALLDAFRSKHASMLQTLIMDVCGTRASATATVREVLLAVLERLGRLVYGGDGTLTRPEAAETLDEVTRRWLS